MGMYYQNYIIFDTEETGSIDFNQVAETSANTLRLNLLSTKTFVKYNGAMPTSVSSLNSKEGPYTHTEILNILAGSEWTAPSSSIE
tara:strand:- start:2352 stop:2609 length:258 start_codon:yes stop_codon:yes gene_type:complete